MVKILIINHPPPTHTHVSENETKIKIKYQVQNHDPTIVSKLGFSNCKLGAFAQFPVVN